MSLYINYGLCQNTMKFITMKLNNEMLYNEKYKNKYF